jgi:hypothetical protein
MAATFSLTLAVVTPWSWGECAGIRLRWTWWVSGGELVQSCFAELVVVHDAGPLEERILGIRCRCVSFLVHGKAVVVARCDVGTEDL